jgi:2,4-dienoyl-CoA reductase-like NADH-dependent reductase (Old Yellow Enzyme family)
VENRCRFILETIDAIAEVFDGPEAICIKICPTDYLNDSAVDFDEIKEVYTYLINEMVKRRVGIITLCRRGASEGEHFGHLNRPKEFPIPEGYDPVLDFGGLVKFPGSPSRLMANNDYTIGEAERLIDEGKIDMIAFGRPFIYNSVGKPFS